MSTMPGKLLFVGDGGQSPCLDRLCARHSVSVDYLIRRAPVRLGLLRRHATYLLLAARAVLARKQYEAIFIWQQYVGLYYFLLSVLFPFYARPTLVYYIIFKGSRSRVLTCAKRRLMLGMARSKHIGKVFFMSRSDSLYPLVPAEKRAVLNSLYLHSEFIEGHLAGETPDRGYFFSGGASNRDYGVLKRLAEAMLGERFEVACLPQAAASLAPLPANLRIRTDAYGHAFEALILGSKAVILPLVDPNVMSGQIVCLRAMQAGKPVFMTRNNFVADWIREVDTLEFITMYNDIEELQAMLTGLDEETLRRAGAEARAYYFDHFLEERFYGRFVQEITALSSDLSRARILA